MKKQITSLAAGLLMAASMSVTAFAASSVQAAAITQPAQIYTACTVEGCNVTDAHQHDGCYYAGHTIGDGHSYHQVCSVANCTLTENHDHNGTTYFGHHDEDGHAYHNSTEHHYRGRHGGHRRGGHHR